MATEIGFYHCRTMPVLDVAARLAAKAHETGGRLLILGEGEALAVLDRRLWTAEATSFLPHARAGGDVDDAQPILLLPVASDGNGEERAAPVNGATMLMLVEVAVPPGIERFARVFNLFADGAAAHEQARADWKALADAADVERSYWQQQPGGGWKKL